MKNMKNIMSAIAQIQQTVPKVTKSKSGYGYKYAELDAIMDAVKPLMLQHGVVYSQYLQYEDGVNKLVTMLYQIDSEESLISKVALPTLEYVQGLSKQNEIKYDIKGFSGMNEAQAIGSLHTYFKRYQIASMLGIIAEEDTDASDPAKGARNAPQLEKPYTPKSEKPWLSQKQFDNTLVAINEGKIVEVRDWLKGFNINNKYKVVLDGLLNTAK